MEDESNVLSGLVYGDELPKVYRARRQKQLFKTVPNEVLEIAKSEGWEVFKVNRNTARLCKPKPVGQALEDETWCLFADLGFDQMNGRSKFVIPVAKKGGDVPPKQVDVFAKDKDTVLMIECKENASPSKRYLQKDLAETYSNKGPMAQAIKNHYGRSAKLKIGWLFVTRNVIWSPNDLERAKDHGIHVIKDDDFEYYTRLTEHIGPAARHQLQADIFRNQKIPGLDVAIPALRGKMGGKAFYSFMIDPERLLRISFVSHRAKADEESLVSYQRMLKKARLKKISEFIENKGIFPTSIVLNILSDRPLRFDLGNSDPDSPVTFGVLYLPNSYKSAWIIDGQHRLYGFSGSPWASRSTLSVIAFENLHASEQARLFIDINHEQVRVAKSLLVDLAADLYWGSPRDDDQLYALHSKIAAQLGKDLRSPLRNRMVTEGKKQSPERPITLTGTYEAIRRTQLVGTIQKGKLYPGPLYETNSKKTLQRSIDILSRYLEVFRQALPDQWALGSAKGGYLCTNNGVGPLLKLLSAIDSHCKNKLGKDMSTKSPEEFMEEVMPFITPLVTFFNTASPQDFADFRRNIGEKGQSNSTFAMMSVINKKNQTFDPPGLQEFLKSKDTEWTEKARHLVPEIQLYLQRMTLQLLEEIHGEGEENWWRKGVPVTVRADVAQRRETNPHGGELESFFELIDYKKIAGAPDNWKIFQDYFTFEDSGKKDDRLAWFDKLNTIRNKVAHPERGPVSSSELDFLNSVYEHLRAKDGTSSDNFPANSGDD